MVLVDFTLAERWRIFGELSLAQTPRKAKAPAASTSMESKYASAKGLIDPQESVARTHAQATLMQRML
jgi:hypothetical protein